MTYDLLYNSMSLGTMITDMSAALEDAGAANSGVTIVATGENTWTVSGGPARRRRAERAARSARPRRRLRHRFC